MLSTGGVTGIDFQGSRVVPGLRRRPQHDREQRLCLRRRLRYRESPIRRTRRLGTPATPAQELLLDPITGDPGTQTFYDHYDVTELVINFDMQPGFDQVAFKIVFGSEEYPEFVDSPFIDGFGMFLNGVNIAQVGNQPGQHQAPGHDRHHHRHRAGRHPGPRRQSGADLRWRS